MLPTLEAAGREEIAKKIVEALMGATYITFTPRLTPGDLQEGEWRLIQSTDGNWIGKLIFEAKDQVDIRKVFAKIYGSAVEIDGMSHTIEVSSDFLKNPLLCGR